MLGHFSIPEVILDVRYENRTNVFSNLMFTLGKNTELYEKVISLDQNRKNLRSYQISIIGKYNKFEWFMNFLTKKNFFHQAQNRIQYYLWKPFYDWLSKKSNRLYF